MPLSTLRETPHAVPRKTQGQDGFATSFPVGLLHPLQHAGLARRTPVCPSLAHNKLFRSSARRGFPSDSDNRRPSPDLRWRTTKSAVGLDLSKLEVSAPFHDFPWMGRNFA